MTVAGNQLKWGHYLEDEDRWIECIQRGEHVAFEALFKTYYKPLSRFAWRFVQEESIAEEITQGVFAWVWENREHIRITEKISSYLYKAVRNQSLNFIKQHKLQVEYTTRWAESHDVVTNPIHASRDPDSESIRLEQLQELIGRAIEELPPRSKMTYKLHRYDGLTYQEISEVMNISVKTVESQMTRTLQILRQRLGHVLFLLSILSIG